MFLGAPFWSIPLVNLAMIGIAIEAATRRVSRSWLIAPLLFFGVYWSLAVKDYASLSHLTAVYQAANSRVAIEFDPALQALVFGGETTNGNFATTYGLPVQYEVNSNHPEGFVSSRVVDKAVCELLRKPSLERQTDAYEHGIFDDSGGVQSDLDERFCNVSMPEKPSLPMVRVVRQSEDTNAWFLPVEKVTTTVTLPDGRQYQLVEGYASPLPWIPMPLAGCTLISARASWECGAQFLRANSISIVSSPNEHNSGDAILARALGLKPVTAAERKASDPAPILARLAAFEKTKREGPTD
jgi:hypothetical protein